MSLLRAFPTAQAQDPRTLTPPERLEHDCDRAYAVRDALSKKVSTSCNRLLAMVSAAPGSAQLLIPTLRNLLDQCKHTSIQPHILVGLNNGARVPSDLLEDLASVRRLGLAAKNKLEDRSVFEQTHGRTTFMKWFERSRDPQVLFLEQPASPIASGKIRMYREIMQLVLRHGNDLPARTLLFDAESRFVPGVSSRKKPDLEGNGLLPWWETTNIHPEYAVLGMRSRTIVYGADDEGFGQPDPNCPLSAHHYLGNILRERTDDPGMAGGGMGGRTPDTLALLATVAEYPVRAEDTAMARLAEHLQWKKGTEHGSVVLNRAPGRHRFDDAMRQIARWNKSTEALDALYPPPRVPDTKTSLERLKERTKNVFDLYRGNPLLVARVLYERSYIQRLMSGMHEDPVNGEQAHW